MAGTNVYRRTPYHVYVSPLFIHQYMPHLTFHTKSRVTLIVINTGGYLAHNGRVYQFHEYI